MNTSLKYRNVQPGFRLLHKFLLWRESRNKRSKGMPTRATIAIVGIFHEKHPMSWDTADKTLFIFIGTILALMVFFLTWLPLILIVSYLSALVINTLLWLMGGGLYFRYCPTGYLNKLPQSVREDELNKLTKLFCGSFRWGSVKRLILEGITPKEFRTIVECSNDHEQILRLARGSDYDLYY